MVVGLRLDEKRTTSECDGKYDGERLFRCKAGFGMFVPIDDVTVGWCRLKPVDTQFESALARKWGSPPMDQYSLTLKNGAGPLCTIQRLKAKCDEALSNFAFSLNLRRYIKAIDEKGDDDEWEPLPGPAGSTVGGAYDPIDALERVVGHSGAKTSIQVGPAPLIPALFARGVPEYLYAPAASPSVAWPLAQSGWAEKFSQVEPDRLLVARPCVQAIVNALEVNKRRVDAGGRAEPAPHMVLVGSPGCGKSMLAGAYTRSR